MKKLLIISCTAFILFLSTSVRAHAFTFLTGNSSEVAIGEEINGSVFMAGEQVTVSGFINGDLFCAGQNVRITGTVRGDVLCVAQTLEIEGSVDGDVRSAGQTIRLAGDVTKNTTLAGQTITLTESGIVGGEMAVWAQTVRVDGRLARSLLAHSQDVQINGILAEGMRVESESLSVGQSASISGTNVFVGSIAPSVDPQASVSAITQEIPKKSEEKNRNTKASNPESLIGKVIFGTIMMWIAGWVLWKFFPTFIDNIQQQLALFSGRVALWGTALLIGGPLVFILLLITILGIPIAFVLLFAWIIVLMCSSTVLAFTVGSWVLQRFSTKEKPSELKKLLVGAPVITILMSLPIVGGILTLVTTIMGSGAILRAIFRRPKLQPKK